MDEEIEKFFFMLSTTTTSGTSSSRTQGSEPIILLSGPANSGKTSLLFQYAFNSAKVASAANVTDSQTQYSSPQVVFICKRSKLQIKPPFLSQGIDPASRVFQLIHIK